MDIMGESYLQWTGGNSFNVHVPYIHVIMQHFHNILAKYWHSQSGVYVVVDETCTERMYKNVLYMEGLHVLNLK